MKNQLVFKAAKPYDLVIRIFNEKVYMHFEYATDNGSVLFVFNNNTFSICITPNENTSEFFEKCNYHLDINFRFNNIDSKTHCLTEEKTFKNAEINKNAIIICDIYDEIFVNDFQYHIKKSLGNSYYDYSMELTLSDIKEE